VRKQKTDRQDAQLILQLMLEDRFPQIWVPSWEKMIPVAAVRVCATTSSYSADLH
jgi:hypothetical protein